MRIGVISLIVQDQQHALEFYTSVLGFVKKQDIPLGEFSWLTVVSPDDLDGVELSLEPNDHEAGASYQKALFEDGIPATSFAVADMQEEYDRLITLGVEFVSVPTDMGGAKLATFNDTCGNWIQIAGA
jgi:catechol 2,3-dioxygenase-like lactoylglutathione lyase family enzyme